MKFFAHALTLRLRKEEFDEIEKLIEKDDEIKTFSHFARISIIKEINRRQDGI